MQRAEKMKLFITILTFLIIGSANGQNNMKTISEEIITTYIDKLNQIRVNPELLKNFDFKDGDPNHIERNRINIALFNDFNISDYPIAKYLFEQESIWRGSPNYYETGDVDNLYFSALLISKYRQPEMVLEFYKTKMIDFDSGIGFDGEFLLSNGKKETFEFLQQSNDPIKSKIFKHVGTSIKTCSYKDEDLQNWFEFKQEYFKNYILPIDDNMWFLYSTKEIETLESEFESWVEEHDSWNLDNIWKYALYSEYLEKPSHQIIALEKQIELQNKPVNEQHWRYNGLIKAYFNHSRPAESIELIESILKEIEGKNRRKQYVEIMCDFILTNKHKETHERILKLIDKEVNDYGSFSMNIDEKLVLIRNRME